MPHKAGSVGYDNIPLSAPAHVELQNEIIEAHNH
jgi:hypothetical protein